MAREIHGAMIGLACQMGLQHEHVREYVRDLLISDICRFTSLDQRNSQAILVVGVCRRSSIVWSRKRRFAVERESMRKYWTACLCVSFELGNQLIEAMTNTFRMK